MNLAEKVEAINSIKLALKEVSPFSAEPVDRVIWVPNANAIANDYNPNSCGPARNEALAHSIAEDGYTSQLFLGAGKAFMK